MTDKLTDEQKDKLFFKQQMAEVQPLKKHSKNDRIVIKKPVRRSAVTPQTSKPRQAKLAPSSSSKPLFTQAIENVEAADAILFARSGVQKKVIHRLSKDRFPIEGTLDLHGMTVSEAEEALALFLKKAYQNRWRVIRIIHGKGRRSCTTSAPVLKNWLNRWLREQAIVMAFCSARFYHGGTGAIYVLLKKQPL